LIYRKAEIPEQFIILNRVRPLSPPRHG